MVYDNKKTHLCKNRGRNPRKIQSINRVEIAAHREKIAVAVAPSGCIVIRPGWGRRRACKLRDIQKMRIIARILADGLKTGHHQPLPNFVGRRRVVEKTQRLKGDLRAARNTSGARLKMIEVCVIDA